MVQTSCRNDEAIRPGPLGPCSVGRHHFGHAPLQVSFVDFENRHGQGSQSAHIKLFGAALALAMSCY
jgi:hypothetical protein